ncbi:MAG: lycopene cyclase family protein [Cyclobacteriaceae bacterium]
MSYDYIIAGGGLGGLTFAHRLIRSDLSFEKVLIIDRDEKKVNDRTWSFWSEEEPEYACARGQSWDQLGFISDEFSKYEEINPYRYYTIQGLEYYDEIRTELASDGRFEWLKSDISTITEQNDHVLVLTGKGRFTGKQVVDSITRPRLSDKDSINVWQSFLGWTINTSKPVFNPQRPILMDFRLPQIEGVCFAYVLPYSSTNALVEYTQFTSLRKIDKPSYRQHLALYLKDQWGLVRYDRLDEEIGQIPMTNHAFDPHPSPRIHRLGTAGGDTKPTTGYTFTNVQQHAKSIVQGQPLPSEDKARFTFYDTLLLQIIKKQPQQVKPIMEYLFRSQPLSRVLRFLDEETNPLEEMLIFGRLPWMPFIHSLSKKLRRDFSS